MWEEFRTTISSLCTMDDHEFDLARPYFHEKLFLKGDFFIKEGQHCTQLAFVSRGICRSFYLNAQGDEETYCFCMDREIETSFESFISGNPSTLSIVAMEDSKLLVIEKRDLDILLDKNLFWNKLARVLIEREYLKMTAHSAEMKTDQARERYLNILQQRPALFQRVPLHYIASYLGISSRHLTRMRRALAEPPSINAKR